MRQNQSKQRLPKPQYSIPARRPIPPSSTVPQPQPQQKTLASMTSTLASTMFQGFGFGVGSSVARKAVDHVFDSTTTATSNGPPPPPPQQDKKVKCEEVWENYKTCLNSSSAECHHFFDDFSRCIHYDDKKSPS